MAFRGEGVPEMTALVVQVGMSGKRRIYSLRQFSFRTPKLKEENIC